MRTQPSSSSGTVQVKCHHLTSRLQLRPAPEVCNVCTSCGVSKNVFKHLLCALPMQMYKYANLSRKGANNNGALQQFALKGYEHFKALPVPQPQSFWTAAIKELFATQLVSTPGVLCKLTKKAVQACASIWQLFWVECLLQQHSSVTVM